MFQRLFSKRQAVDAGALYAALVEAARRPGFYEAGGVQDSVEGRFEMLALHVYLVLRRARAEGDAAAPFSQSLFDTFCRDIDVNLRELGAGDMSIGKRVKGYVKSFYGRIAAYDQAIDDDDMAALSDAIDRNLLGGAPESDETTMALARYTMSANSGLTDQAFADIVQGKVEFPDPPQELKT